MKDERKTIKTFPPIQPDDFYKKIGPGKWESAGDGSVLRTSELYGSYGLHWKELVALQVASDNRMRHFCHVHAAWLIIWLRHSMLTRGDMRKLAPNILDELTKAKNKTSLNTIGDDIRNWTRPYFTDDMLEEAKVLIRRPKTAADRNRFHLVFGECFVRIGYSPFYGENKGSVEH